MIISMPKHLIRLLVTSTLAIACATSIAAPLRASAATGVGADFGPDVVLTQLHGSITQRGMSTTFHWALPDRYRAQQLVDLDPTDEHTVIDIDRGTTVLGSGFPSAVRFVVHGRNTASVAPDGFAAIDGDIMYVAWPLIARVRSGGAALTPVVAGGRRYLRGTTALAANECAGLPKGSRTVLLDAKTLVPARVIERRGGAVDRDLRFTPRAHRASDFSKLHVIGARQVHDDGYVRRSPAAAASLVTFPISLPAALPAGFGLVQTGSAKWGAPVGPEASFPQGKGLFFAQWRRGLEAIDFTIRGARGTLARDWDESDPFGTECGASVASSVAIGAVTGRYAVGENGAPRLWWRTGSTLYTLSGPFSAEQLATVARSLTPIG